MAEVGRFRRGARPFDFARGAPRPGRYSPDHLDIRGAIAAIRYAPVEIGYGFDAEGRQIFRQVGDPDEIRGFDPRDLRAMTDGAFVHSHPPYDRFPEGDSRRRAGSFSARDLTFMYENNLTEIVAVTRERAYFLRPLGGFFLDPDQIRRDYTRTLRQVETGLKLLAARGMISIDEALSAGRIADEVMDRLSPFFVYRWEEV